MPYFFKSEIPKDFEFKAIYEIAKDINDSYKWRAKQIYQAISSPDKMSKSELFEFGQFVYKMLDHSKKMDCSKTDYYDNICGFKIYIERVLRKAEQKEIQNEEKK